MTVSIPSDLVLDVLRNAPSDATGVSRARLRLEEGSAVADNTPFVDVIGGLSKPGEPLGDPTAIRKDSSDTGPEVGSVERFAAPGNGFVNPHVAFEHMFIRNMLESILPGSESGVFGDEAASSGIWRSLVADQLSSAYVEGGGVGISKALERRASVGNLIDTQQWPYFLQSDISSFVGT